MSGNGNQQGRDASMRIDLTGFDKLNSHDRVGISGDNVNLNILVFYVCFFVSYTSLFKFMRTFDPSLGQILKMIKHTLLNWKYTLPSRQFWDCGR